MSKSPLISSDLTWISWLTHFIMYMIFHHRCEVVIRHNQSHTKCEKRCDKQRVLQEQKRKENVRGQHSIIYVTRRLHTGWGVFCEVVPDRYASCSHRHTALTHPQNQWHANITLQPHRCMALLLLLKQSWEYEHCMMWRFLR